MVIRTYTISGGNEKPEVNDYYAESFFNVNDGSGKFPKIEGFITKNPISECCTAGDFDEEGDLDLFEGPRVQPNNLWFADKSFRR